LLRFAEGSITITGLEQQARVSRAGAGVGWVDVERALEILNGGVVIAAGEVPGGQAEVAGRIAWRGRYALLIDLERPLELSVRTQVVGLTDVRRRDPGK